MECEIDIQMPGHAGFDVVRHRCLRFSNRHLHFGGSIPPQDTNMNSFVLGAGMHATRGGVAFPGAAGTLENGVDRYIEGAEQPAVIQATAPDLAANL